MTRRPRPRWRDDPAVRTLRIASWITFLVLVAYMVLDQHADNPATFGTLVGALIVYSGLETGIRLPEPSERENDND